jgi:hydroxyacylglutathione hydrolase
MLKVTSFTFNAISENTYVIWDEDTLDAAVIDPGCYDTDEQEELKEFITSHKLNLKSILSTHSHIDHVLGNFFVKKTWNIPLYIGEMDADTLRAVPSYAPSYGFHMYQPVEPDILLQEGSQIIIGKQTLDVIFVPGHAPGHIAFVHHAEKKIFAGDVLFNGSIGRTDLPGGNYDILEKSIKTKIYTLSDDYIIYPGHGGPTSVGKEKKSNPYIRG